MIKTSKKSGNVTSTEVKSKTLGNIDYNGDFKPTSSSKMAKGGKVKLSNDGKLPNGKYEYVKGDEGMFQGNKVRVVKYSTSYGGMYEYNIIDENGKIKTHGATKADKFEKQFTYSPKMAMGGTTKFKDKVQSIKASLLKRKKVSPKVQKDYGKTYSPKEAEDSAKRIVGSMVKKEKRKPRVSKMLEKMKKGTQLNKKKSTFKDRMKELSNKIKERKSKSTK